MCCRDKHHPPVQSLFLSMSEGLMDFLRKSQIGPQGFAKEKDIGGFYVEFCSCFCRQPRRWGLPNSAHQLRKVGKFFSSKFSCISQEIFLGGGGGVPLISEEDALFSPSFRVNCMEGFVSVPDFLMNPLAVTNSNKPYIQPCAHWQC